MRGLYVNLVGCFYAAQAVALYNGNPSMPKMPESGFFIGPDVFVGTKIGYLCDVIDRSAAHIQGEWENHSSRYTSLVHQGILTLNWGDRFELFGGMGTQERALKDTKARADVSSFVWSVGMRALVAYWGNWELAASASSLKSLPFHADAKQLSWQVGIGTCYRWGSLLPYLGMSYGHYQSTFSPILRCRNAHSLGAFTGIGLGLSKGFNLNMETRVFSEYGGSVSVDLKF